VSNLETAQPQQPVRVRALFDSIARRYDLINDLQSLGLHRRWKRWLVTLAQPQPGDWALDVCCGTGDIALELLRRGAGAVVGLDFSEAMLRIAQARAARLRTGACGWGGQPGHSLPMCRGYAHAQKLQAESSNADVGQPAVPPCAWFVQADALRLPFGDRTFDIVTVGYGLRNLADWQAGVTELWRVLRPGGRLLVLDFGKPAHPVWRAVYLGYLRWGVPWLGRLICGNAPAYRYILESLRVYPAQVGVAAWLSRLPGLVDLRVLELLGGAMSIHFARKGS